MNNTALEKLAMFGRWSFDARSNAVALSAMAARYLHVAEQPQTPLADLCTHVFPADIPKLVSLIQGNESELGAEVEFRVRDAQSGVRWLRAVQAAKNEGVLLDITVLKQATVREHLGYEITQYLVGAHRLDDAIPFVIQLICNHLGWDWGAYWTLDDTLPTGPMLSCKYSWQQPNADFEEFNKASAVLKMAPGTGIVGRVWATGIAEWVDDIFTNPQFVQPESAKTAGLRSGYIFPVTFVSNGGTRHRPGVMEFYSTLSRQPDAQLPKLSSIIGAVVAQTSERLEREAVIQRLAQVDDLSELSNRNYFHQQLREKCESAAAEGISFSLMFIDLDRFKAINDAFGHDAGNYVLREFSTRIQSLPLHNAILGRLGGDEFAMIVPNGDSDVLSTLADQILEVARTPFRYDDTELTISASIGISRFPQNGRTGPELLRSADMAMYRVKQNGRNAFDILNSSSPTSIAILQASVVQRLAIETELHHAILGNTLSLQYQPIFDVSKNELHAVEALIRWKKSDGQMVSPEVFIPIAEQSHLIVEIGRWVMGQVCKDLVHFRDATGQELKVHVNMAAAEFTNEQLPETLAAIIKKHDVNPTCITLELTEGMLMKQPNQVIRVMHNLRRLGVDISLDDFGMGHSSLSLLRSLPITSMKVDRSFVRDIVTNKKDQAIAKTILDLGRALQFDVIAEGVEHEEQQRVLTRNGCKLIQGYLLSRPMALDALIQSVLVPLGQSH